MKPDKIYLFLSLLVLVTVFTWFTSCSHKAKIADIPEVCFTVDVLSIFTNNCSITGCHDGTGESHLVLNYYPDIRRQVYAGNPDVSHLYLAILGKGEGLMPPDKPLSIENRTKIRVWIEQGAAFTTCADTTATGYVIHPCFARDILPVLVSRCTAASCHDGITQAGGHVYTDYTSTMTSVTPGDPPGSHMFEHITLTSGPSKMPPEGSPQLTGAEIDLIAKWIGYGALNENCGEICDTINPVTYSGTILPVLQSTCRGCHSGISPSGNVLLESYNNVATIASNGTLLKALNGAGVTRMPFGGSLSVCRIRQFTVWVNNGYLNN